MKLQTFGNPKSTQSVLVVLGTKNPDDHRDYNSIIQALQENNSVDINLLDYSNTDFSKDAFSSHLAEFYKKEHPEKMIIIAAHGMQIFPYASHYSFFGEDVKKLTFLESWLPEALYELSENAYGFILGLWSGNTVRSTDLLDVIGSTAKTQNISGENLGIWHFTCQSQKLLESANNALPEGTNYVTETQGIYKKSIFLNTLLQTLSQNEEFTFSELYHSYLAMAHKSEYYEAREKTNTPTLAKIGSNSHQTSIEKLDQLVEDAKNDKIDQEKMETSIIQSCHLIAAAKVAIPNEEHTLSSSEFYKNNTALQNNINYCLSFTTKKTANMAYVAKLLPEKSFAKCIDHSGDGSYFGRMFSDHEEETFNSDCISPLFAWDNHTFLGGLERLSLLSELYYS